MASNAHANAASYSEDDERNDDGTLAPAPTVYGSGAESNDGADDEDGGYPWPADDAPLLVDDAPMPMEDETDHIGDADDMVDGDQDAEYARDEEWDWRQRAPEETLRAWQAKQLYLLQGISRTLKRVAERIADEENLLWQGFRLTPANIDKQIAKHGEKYRGPEWTTRVGGLHRQLKAWSSRFDWEGAAQAYDAAWARQLAREQMAAILRMNEDHALIGQHMQKLALETMDEDKREHRASAQSTVQKMALGLQTERVARLGGQQKGAGDVAALLGSLANPAALVGQSGRGGTGSGGGDTPAQVTIHQQTTTNNNTVQISGPLTVDVLRQLQRETVEQLAAFRAHYGLPAPLATDGNGSGETNGNDAEPWIVNADPTVSTTEISAPPPTAPAPAPAPAPLPPSPSPSSETETE